MVDIDINCNWFNLIKHDLMHEFVREFGADSIYAMIHYVHVDYYDQLGFKKCVYKNKSNDNKVCMKFNGKI